MAPCAIRAGFPGGDPERAPPGQDRAALARPQVPLLNVTGSVSSSF